MSRPLWKPRAEPRVRQPRCPYKHLGKRVRNRWAKTTGTIARAQWDGWHWEIWIAYDDGKQRCWHWNTCNFWQHNELILPTANKQEHQ